MTHALQNSWTINSCCPVPVYLTNVKMEHYNQAMHRLMNVHRRGFNEVRLSWTINPAQSDNGTTAVSARAVA